MRVLTCIGIGCSFALARLRETGHEVTILNDEVSFEEGVKAHRSEKPDVFFWNPGAPIQDIFRQVERFRQALDNPPIVIFNAMPREWSEHCAQMSWERVRVVGFSTENFDADLEAVVKK